MVTSRQIKEKIRDYRRSIKHSWNLFKESRIGLVGLTIMVFFVVMALVSPYLGLRHPLDWWAPDEDILDIKTFYAGEEGFRTDGAFMQGVSVASKVYKGPLPKGTWIRLYAGGGLPPDDPLGSYKPFGIYAYDHVDGGRKWNQPTGSPLSTDITVFDFFSIPASTDVDRDRPLIIFGTEDGTVWAMKDWQDAPPNPEFQWRYKVNGSVEGIACSEKMEMFFVSTENGWLYAFKVPNPSLIPGSFPQRYNFNKPIELWNISVSNVSLTSPTVSNKDEGYVYVGSRDGQLHAYLAESGQDVLEWTGPYLVSESYWSGSPVADINGLFIYAATDDGIIHCILAENGTSKDGWAHVEVDANQQVVSKPGYQVKNKLGDPDGGNLSEISLGISNLIVGSDTGIVYSINLQSIPTENYKFDTRVGSQDTSVEIAPYYDLVTESMFIFARHFNDTTTPSDDFTIAYNLKGSANDTVIWRKILDGVTVAQPSLCLDPQSAITGRIGYDLVFATVFFEEDGTSTTGRMHSVSASGSVITPLPPTWVTSEDAEEVKFRPPPSGNKYWLGTDIQGHDILSQTVLGSRIALLVGFLSALFSISIGVIFGLVSGYYGKGIDALLMRFTDVILVLPSLPLLITFAAIMNPSIWNIILIISLVGWGGVARVIRAEVLSLKERPFIDSARVTGASKSRIMFKHIAPNVLPLGLLYMTFAVSGAILFEASLSFIGLGDPSTMTWGMMLNYVQHSNALTNWWWLLPPGICITLVCMAFFLLGRAFDEIVNPRLRRRR